MARLIFRGTVVDAEATETVLEALLRHGHDVPNGCRRGVCHACVMRADGAPPPVPAQVALPSTKQAQGWFLPCVCPASRDLVLVDGADFGLYARAEVLDKRLVGDVCVLRLVPFTRFDFRPGQFVRVLGPEGIGRSYSLASIPDDGWLELHVRRVPGGHVSTWIHDVLRVGDVVELVGPNGDCTYVPGREGGPLLLIGGGTGLAPLYGVLRQALEGGHRGRIELFHGSATIEGFYLDRELRALVEAHANLRYTPCLDGPMRAFGTVRGRVDTVAFAAHPNLAGFRVYACGAPGLVRSAERAAYLAGAALPDIFTDPFEPSGAPPTPSRTDARAP